MASALDRLKKAANLTPTKRTVTLSDDTKFEFYSAPLTMAERERAQKMPGGDDTNGFALNLLVTKAVDDTGKRLFTAGEIAELKNEVMDADLQQVIAELAVRDARDMARQSAPLMPAADAVQLDTTGLTIVQVLESILQLSAERGLYHFRP